MAKNNKNNDIHTISTLVANKPGVLVRVAQVFARRGYNIDALAVSPAVDERFSRMTITAQGDLAILDQIIKQVNKLVDVIHAEEHGTMDAVHREMALVKIKVTETQRQVLSKWAKKFKAHLVHEEEGILIIAQIGTTEELDEMEGFLKKYGIIEMVRSGKLVMAKGKDAT